MFDFEVKNNRIYVGDTYAVKDNINDYFGTHRLNDKYSTTQIKELIDSVAFILDAENGFEDFTIDDDYLRLKAMLTTN